MGMLWPRGWTRIRRGALLIVNGLALWLTALLIHVFQNPTTWNLARSQRSEVVGMVVATTVQWGTELTNTPSGLVAYLGGVLVIVGIGWYWLLRPVVVRHTGILVSISESDAADGEDTIVARNKGSQ